MAATAPYVIGAQLGRGAVAAVHEVRDAQGQVFAGKLLHASRDGDQAAAARFRQEAELLEGLVHDNIVRVFGWSRGVDADGLEHDFVRMELVEGDALDTWIASEAPFAEGRVLELGRQLAAGLTHAHAEGLVHRDLKPSNILVAREGETATLKIADFGMARASSLGGVDPSALTVLGTPDYMAPESLEPIAVDTRTDLYALGCILFEMLTGRVPFMAATPFGVLQRHRDDPVPALPEGVSAGLRGLVQSLLAKSPADRPPSASAVERRLVELQRGEGGALVPVETVGSSCAGCGQALVEELSVCLNCGLPCVRIERGKHLVLVTGPGEVGDKIDTQLRERLVEWMGKSPHLGLEGTKAVNKQVPRLPFVFVPKVSQRTAAAIVASLQALGLEAEAHEGRPSKHPLMRQKIRKLAGRASLIVLSSMAYTAQHGAAILVALGLVGVGTAGAMAVWSTRSVTARKGPAQKALGGPVQRALAKVEQLVPTLDEARHRHALRAVVRDALELRRALGPSGEHDRELAGAIESASATTAALARIDTELAKTDLNRAGDEARDRLHQRDVYASRMLELAGTIESLRRRLRATADPQAKAASLDELRAHIEALEEIRAR